MEGPQGSLPWADDSKSPSRPREGATTKDGSLAPQAGPRPPPLNHAKAAAARTGAACPWRRAVFWGTQASNVPWGPGREAQRAPAAVGQSRDLASGVPEPRHQAAQGRPCSYLSKSPRWRSRSSSRRRAAPRPAAWLPARRAARAGGAGARGQEPGSGANTGPAPQTAPGRGGRCLPGVGRWGGGAGGGDGFLLNHFDQKLLTCICMGYKVNRFLYTSFQTAIICKGRRKRNESCEQNLCDVLPSKYTWKRH